MPHPHRTDAAADAAADAAIEGALEAAKGDPAPTPETAVPTVAQPRNLDRTLVTSVAWSAAAKWAVQVASWAGTIVVARLLVASDYGMLGMSGVFMGLVALLSEMGIGSAVLMLRDLREEVVAQLNTLALLVGFGAFALTAAAAPLIGRFFHSTELPAVMTVMGLTFILGGLRSVPNAVLQKGLRFKLLSTFDAVSALVQSVVTIVFAYLGFRYWSFVITQLVGAGLTTGLVLYHARRPYRRIRWADLRPALGFSNRVIVGRLAWYSYSNADFVVAGRVLGASSLGIYSFGWNLTSLAIDKIASLVNVVTPAFFSAMQRDAAGLRRMLLGITEGLALVVLPVTVGIALVAPDLIPVMFSAKWAPSVPVVQLLVLYGVLRALRPVQNNVLVSTGDAGFMMWISIVSAVVFPAAFFVGARYGPTGIAAAWAVLYPVSMGVGYVRLFQRKIVTPREYGRALWPALQAALVMAVTVLVLQRWVLADARAAVRLAACIAAGALAYAGVLFAFHRPRIERFATLLRQARARPAVA